MAKQLQKRVGCGAWQPEVVGFLRGFCMRAKPTFEDVWKRLANGATVRILNYEFRLSDVEIQVRPGDGLLKRLAQHRRAHSHESTDVPDPHPGIDTAHDNAGPMQHEYTAPRGHPSNDPQ